MKSHGRPNDAQYGAKQQSSEHAARRRYFGQVTDAQIVAIALVGGSIPH